MRKNLKLMTLPDGGGAPEGRRERKSWQFLMENIWFSGFPDLARWPRSRAKHTETRPISPSAAPPQLPRQEEPRPGRAAKRAGAGAERRPLLPHLQIWECPDPCTRPVGNALMRSETHRFVPVSTVLRARRFYLLLMGEVPRRGGGREKTGSFCWKIFGFFRLSYLVRWPRSPAEPLEARPISPSAAPPQLPRQEELRPGRAVRRAQACVSQVSAACTTNPNCSYSTAP